MKLLDKFRKKEVVSFEEIDSLEKVKEEYKKGNLEKFYLISPIFGGAEDESNILYVPKGINKIKEGYDKQLEKLLREEKIESYDCTPEYKGNSFVPSKITITSGKDGKIVFQETIEIW